MLNLTQVGFLRAAVRHIPVVHDRTSDRNILSFNKAQRLFQKQHCISRIGKSLAQDESPEQQRALKADVLQPVLDPETVEEDDADQRPELPVRHEFSRSRAAGSLATEGCPSNLILA